jgi:hypothetical protein
MIKQNSHREGSQNVDFIKKKANRLQVILMLACYASPITAESLENRTEMVPEKSGPSRW